MAIKVTDATKLLKESSDLATAAAFWGALASVWFLYPSWVLWPALALCLTVAVLPWCLKHWAPIAFVLGVITLLAVAAWKILNWVVHLFVATGFWLVDRRKPATPGIAYETPRQAISAPVNKLRAAVADKQTPEAKLLAEQRKLWARFTAHDTRWPPVEVRRVEMVPGGFRVQVRIMPDRETGQRCSVSHVMKFKPDVRALYDGRCSHSFDMQPWNGKEAFTVTAIATDPLALHGTALHHPYAALEAPHVPVDAGNMLDPIQIGLDTFGTPYSIPVGHGMHAMIYGVTGKGKDNLVSCLLWALLVRAGVRVSIIAYEDSVAGKADYRHLAPCLGGYLAGENAKRPGNAAKAMKQWLQAVEERAATENGGDDTKVTTFLEVLIVSGMKAMDAAAANQFGMIVSDARKQGAMVIGIDQIPRLEGRTAMQKDGTGQAYTIVQMGASVKPDHFRMAFGDSATDLELAHLRTDRKGVGIVSLAGQRTPVLVYLAGPKFRVATRWLAQHRTAQKIGRSDTGLTTGTPRSDIRSDKEPLGLTTGLTTGTPRSDIRPDMSDLETLTPCTGAMPDPDTTTGRILALIMASPGIEQQTVAQQLGTTTRNVRRHVLTLQNAGLITIEPGQIPRFHPTPKGDK